MTIPSSKRESRGIGLEPTKAMLTSGLIFLDLRTSMTVEPCETSTSSLPEPYSITTFMQQHCHTRTYFYRIAGKRIIDTGDMGEA